MGAELGRISGPLLAANLLRHGTDLAFETSLLYLDVNNGLIGIKTSTPSKELEVNGTATTTNLIVDTKATIAGLNIVSNKIQNLTGNIIVSPNQASDPTIVTNALDTSKLELKGSAVSTLNLNDNINLSPNGAGKVVFTTQRVNVNGNLHATGNITFDGNITFGDSDTDNVVFKSDINSSVIPNINYTYDLGALTKQWNNLFSQNVITDSLTTPGAIINGIDLLHAQGKIYYVSVNGNDANLGNQLHNTFKTIKHALSVCASGDTVFIFPGTYQEIFPLTVPQGVTVVGETLRSVDVIPTVDTNTQDAFLLNGETTVENITVKGFYYDAMFDTGYGFRFANNAKVTTRSPYIRNVSVITEAP